MGGWLDLVPALALALALLIAPGLPVAVFLRVRGVIFLGISIVVSLSAIAIASVLAPWLGISWSLIPVLCVAAVLGLIAGVFARFYKGVVPRKLSVGTKWFPLALAFLCWALVIVIGISDPSRPNQLYDGLFHLNAVEFIAQTGDASPLHMTMSTPTAAINFYPTLWHALVSLVLPVAGGVVQATNIVTVAAVALIWPTSVAVLSQVLFPNRSTVTTWAPLVGLLFSVFPLGFLNWGVLYPNLLGTMLVPLLLATVLMSCEAGLSLARRILFILVAIAAAGATALGHPSALLAGIALLLPLALWRCWEAWMRAAALKRAVLLCAVAVGAVGLALIWQKANVTTNNWLPELTMAQAFGEVAFLSPVERTAGMVLGPLVAIGIWQAIKDRLWWVLGSYSVSIGFYMLAVWFPVLSIRSAFVGVWYDDSTRVGALLAVFALPLAALGATAVADWLAHLWHSGRTTLSVGVGVIIVILGLPHLAVLANDTRHLNQETYELNSESRALTKDEVELFARADKHLADDDVVIGDPLTGAGLLFAYTGHDVVFPHATGRYGADAALLGKSLVGGGPEVCEAIKQLGVTYALDLGDRVLFKDVKYAGLHGLASSPIVTQVEDIGEAKLYQITGCD